MPSKVGAGGDLRNSSSRQSPRFEQAANALGHGPNVATLWQLHSTAVACRQRSTQQIANIAANKL